jgi:ABC-type multidrug transport system fused ATPase/permease subunit
VFKSLKRIDQYLNEEEEIKCSHSPGVCPGFSNATFSWSKEEAKGGHQLQNLNVMFVKGGLNLIVGRTGAGKSSLLLALLGEMRLRGGNYYLPRQEGIAYCSQTAWLQNATIRDNILFGSDFDEERYWKVIEACALRPDLDMFEAADHTEIGEKGITLSGGQKQRVALARAVYSTAETVLLDDILSALDVHVGKHIFENCIIGELLRGRTVLLVTHHVNIAENAAQKIIVLDEGRIVPTAVCATLVPQQFPQYEQNSTLKSVAINDEKLQKNGKLVIDEERHIGRISRKTIFLYMGYFGNPFFLAGLWCAAAIAQGGNIVYDWWIARWSDSYAHDETNVWFYLTVLTLITAGVALNSVIESAFYERGSWSAASKLHRKLVKGVFGAPLSWFDVTPVGRIINRFAKDINTLDKDLKDHLEWVIGYVMQMVFRISAITLLMPIFVVPALVIGAVGWAVGEVYHRY